MAKTPSPPPPSESAPATESASASVDPLTGDLTPSPLAYGVVNMAILDGGGVSRNVKMWSDNAGLTGNLTSMPVLAGVDGANPAAPTNPLPVSGPSRTPVAGAQMALALATAQTLTVPTGATVAVVQAENGDLRWRDDGTAATGAAGMLLYAGAIREFSGSGLGAISLIQATGNTSQANVSYYK
jgi:hypothetical protein